MKPLATRLLIGLALAACALPASAQPAPIPPFRGPEIHEGAWKTVHAWSDPFEGDPGRGSYAYAYQTWAEERAGRHAEEGTRLDCADLSIALLCEYGALHGLPVKWRVYNAPERRFVTIGNEDRQFGSAEQFRLWSQYYLGAMNLADNTVAISYDEWAGGDMVLMDWNQSEEAPNFEGREVWHTYLIGKPGEVVYYGNISGGVPLPVTRVTSGSRLEMVLTHPDRYGESPRRYALLADAVWAPREEATTFAKITRATRLNLRAGPGTEHAVVSQGARGDELAVLGRDGVWVQLRLADGREVWAHGYYLEVRDRAAEPAVGIAGVLGSEL